MPVSMEARAASPVRYAKPLFAMYFPSKASSLAHRRGRPCLHRWLQLLCAALFGLAFCRSGLAQASRPSLPAGVVIPEVVCGANAKQSYALYLPSRFSAARTWPIIYVFDPGARGPVAVEAIRTTAEKFGYIVAASNNSRNGRAGASQEAAEALWDDTQQRFPVDEHRRYLAGMSGGARVATGIAVACGDCVAGVVANAASFPSNREPPRNMKFAYFAAVGDADFNYPEFVELRRKLAGAGARYRIRIFAGKHGWAPAEVWQEALDWMDLRAMAAGSLARDQPRIQKTLEDELRRAAEFQSKNNLLEAFRQYQAVVRDFDGLADISSAQKLLAELERNKAVKAAEKQEAAAVDQQARLTSDLSAEIQAIASGGLDNTNLVELKRGITDLKKQATDAPTSSDPKTLVFRRALGELVVQAYESGQGSMDQKNYRAALLYFDVASAGSENPAWAHYQRARAYAMLSNRKDMFVELRIALAGGFHDPAALEAPEFQAYREQPEFQAFAVQWKLAEKKE
jgi:predicted esterase